jgi:hypothetical protein
MLDAIAAKQQEKEREIERKMEEDRMRKKETARSVARAVVDVIHMLSVRVTRFGELVPFGKCIIIYFCATTTVESYGRCFSIQPLKIMYIILRIIRGSFQSNNFIFRVSGLRNNAQTAETARTLATGGRTRTAAARLTGPGKFGSYIMGHLHNPTDVGENWAARHLRIGLILSVKNVPRHNLLMDTIPPKMSRIFFSRDSGPERENERDNSAWRPGTFTGSKVVVLNF